MSEKYDFSCRLDRWLERFGFINDPFALYEADRERAYLPYFFVDRPYLHDVLGDPTHPQTAFLMARRGAGKTATREMVAYECAHAQLRRRALAVRYYDFTPLLDLVEGDLARLEARHHVRVIARYTLKSLTEDVPSTYFDLLNPVDRGLLMGCAAEFADPVSRLKLGQLLSAEPVSLNWQALSPLETLHLLGEMVTKLGQSPEARYQALYVLIDRVDETKTGSKAAVPLLKPLVSERPLLEASNVAFKFFIPVEVGERLRQEVALRPDRVCIRTITWEDAALRRMIQQRLSYYSEGRIERFGELCTSGAKASAMERLVQACDGSPRTLLRLCQALVHHHVLHADETSTLITRTDLVDTLRDFQHRLEVEQGPLAPPVLASLLAEPPACGLYLDEGGHTWVDGQPLAPPLSELEFRLLRALYQQSPEIVPHDALIEVVWPSPAWMSDQFSRDSDEQNLRKLIGRLRERLEPGVSGREWRFVKNVRGRGYWLDPS